MTSAIVWIVLDVTVDRFRTLAWTCGWYVSEIFFQLAQSAMNPAAQTRLLRALWTSAFGTQGRRSSSFVRDAYINIQQQSSNIPKEQALYSELNVREWLQGFEGGKVHLEKTDSGLVTVVLDYPERKNALSGEEGGLDVQVGLESSGFQVT